MSSIIILVHGGGSVKYTATGFDGGIIYVSKTLSSPMYFEVKMTATAVNGNSFLGWSRNPDVLVENRNISITESVGVGQIPDPKAVYAFFTGVNVTPVGGDCPNALFSEFIAVFETKQVILPIGSLWITVDEVTIDLTTVQINVVSLGSGQNRVRLKLGEFWTHPDGWIVKIIAIEAGRAKICVMPGDLGTIEPPILEDCVFPTLSLSLGDMLGGLAKWIICQLNKLFKPVYGGLTAITDILPKVAEGITYFISGKWLTNLISQFFAALDIWFSVKFGIDPALPFGDELWKKAVSWFFSLLDDKVKDETEFGKW